MRRVANPRRLRGNSRVVKTWDNARDIPPRRAGSPRFSDWTLGLLIALALLAIWEAFLITNRAETRGCGGNFAQYYTAGEIVRGGDILRLYDQDYFRHLQEPLRGDPLPSIYPPTVGMLLAPLTRLSYANALVVWWVIQAVCILATGVLFYRTIGLPQPWRVNCAAGPGCAFAAVDCGRHGPTDSHLRAGAGGRIGFAQARLAE